MKRENDNSNDQKLFPEGSVVSQERKEFVRRELISRFTEWLDTALAEEIQPEGIDKELLNELENTFDLNAVSKDEKQDDYFGILSNLLPLTQEIKLQGRAFKELSSKADMLRDFQSRSNTLLKAHGEALSTAKQIAVDACTNQKEQLTEAREETERKTRKELFTILVDVKDRLVRGLKASDLQINGVDATDRAGFFARLFGKTEDKTNNKIIEAVKALQEGYRLTLDRIEETLQSYGVYEIECLDQSFDPHLMNAAEIETTSRIPDGSVTEVLRAGYRWNGDVLRTANVKVARSETS